MSNVAVLRFNFDASSTRAKTGTPLLTSKIRWYLVHQPEVSVPTSLPDPDTLGERRLSDCGVYAWMRPG